MKHYIITTMMFIAFITPNNHPLSANINIENNAIMSVRLPDWAYTCNETAVYNRPGGDVLRSIDKGERLRIRYGSKDNNYAAIGIAEWVKTSELCK